MAMCALELLKGRGLLLKLRGLFFELSHLEENADGNNLKICPAHGGSTQHRHCIRHWSCRMAAVAALNITLTGQSMIRSDIRVTRSLRRIDDSVAAEGRRRYLRILKRRSQNQVSRTITPQQRPGRFPLPT